MAVQKILCNVCGQIIEKKNGILREDVFEGSKEWGYFSNKDLEVHQFYMCESCYDKMVSSFKVPVTIIRKTEVM